MKSSSSSSDVVLISVFHLLTDRAADGIYISHQHLETQISLMLHVFLEVICTATVHHIGSHAEGWRGVPSAADLFESGVVVIMSQVWRQTDLGLLLDAVGCINGEILKRRTNVSNTS